jgi:hypothetical protein
MYFGDGLTFWKNKSPPSSTWISNTSKTPAETSDELVAYHLLPTSAGFLLDLDV